MIFLPFIFFAYLLFQIIRKNGFDVSACMTSIYMVSSFASIVLSYQDHDYSYDNYSTIEITLLPTLIYCSTIGLCIYPFYKYNSNRRREFSPMRNAKLFDLITCAYIFVFFLLIIMFRTDLIFRFFYGNLDELRKMAYEGYLPNVVESYSGIVRFGATIFTILGEGAYFMILFFFYSICFLNKGKFFNILILISSLSPILMGFLDIDRSRTVFWILLFALAFCLFRPYIRESQKAFLKTTLFVIGGLAVCYLILVTVSRFGERDEGASGGVLVYLGQPFINFCKIWDNVWIDRFFTQRFLPVTTYFLGGGNGGNTVDFIDKIFSATGVHVNVFFSFVGFFLVDMGHLAACVIPLVFLGISTRHVNRYIKRRVVSLSSFIVLFALGIVIQCGIITYFYTSIPRVVAFWIFIFLSKLLYQPFKE